MADNDIDTLKLPPHSVEAEQSLLGGLLIDNESSDKVADVITSKDFYRHDHSIIYQHIIKVIDSNQPADIVTVAESLEKNDELTSIGGLSYLGLLAENTPAASNIRGYAQIVRERSIMRNLVQVGSDIADALNNAGLKVVKAEIRMPDGPLKLIGDHTITIVLHHDVTTDIVVTVIGEDA